MRGTDAGEAWESDTTGNGATDNKRLKIEKEKVHVTRTTRDKT
jgi:hypothetical protein